MHYTLTLWTNRPALAAAADRAGVDRIGVDLERLGKCERQAGQPTWISDHQLTDLPQIAERLGRAQLFARGNPLHPASAAEIESLLAYGVEVLMLPNVQTTREVAEYCALVDGRAKIVPLLERIKAVDCIRDLPGLGIDEFHVGLNDLGLDLGLSHRLGALVSPTLERIAEEAHRAGIRFGIGGIGRAGDQQLPVPSDLVYAQHARLGSTAAMIARSFFPAGAGFPSDLAITSFGDEVSATRQRLDEWAKIPHDRVLAAHSELVACLSRHGDTSNENPSSHTVLE